MKKIVITAALAAISTAAIAESNDIYIDVLGGINSGDDVSGYENNIKATWASSETKSGGSFHLGTGFYLNDNIRLGTRYSYRGSKFEAVTLANAKVTNKARSHALLAEVAYDFTNTSGFTPYVKAGLGVARNSYSAYMPAQNISFDKKTKTSFAWAIGVGVGYKINKNISLLAEYQYSDLGKASTQDFLIGGGNTSHLGTNNHRISEVNLGLRVDF